MPDGPTPQVQEQAPVLQDSTHGSKTEQIQEVVYFLASQYRQASRLLSSFERDGAQRQRSLKAYRAWLAKAHTYFREASKKEITLSAASEWLLDNYYIIQRAIQQIAEDLPASYYNQLPQLEEGPLKGQPRIFAIGQEVLRFQNHLLNMADLQAILIQLQDSIPMTMGELWATPIALRYSLVEKLAHTLETIIPPPSLAQFPPLPPQLTEASRLKSGSTGAAAELSTGETVANTILSLRAISDQSWNDFFEAVSRLEQILREDPAGIYPLMDFKTRDLYRKEIELLSFASGREETQLAQAAVSLAGEHRKGEPAGAARAAGAAGGIEPSSPSDDPALHVGTYLLGEGRSILENRVGYHPGAKATFRRWAMRHASSLYLGSIAVIALILFLLISLAVHPLALFKAGLAWQWIPAIALELILIPPALTVASNLVNWLVTLILPPRILPKMSFKREIPPTSYTLVVIPSLVNSREEVNSLVSQLEMHYLRNPEPGLYFALLTDFQDADSETLPEDAALLAHATQAIEELNARYPRQATNGAPRRPGPTFFLLHRRRLWNPSEGKWMGWERKRGKLHDLNELLRGGENLSFINLSGHSGELDALKQIRFVITLDADTILPRGAALRLVGALAHPLNRARFNEKTGQVISGYTVLQPRMETNPRSSFQSWFTFIFSGDTGLDLYTLAASDAYQDLFGEGSYVGKGIYDVDTFRRSVNGHIPENKVLSHDLLEGIMGRAALVTDITMVEDYPSTYFTQSKRQQRWIRGDWQLLPWLIRPAAFRVKFTAINRWKMMENLVRSLMAPSLLLIYILGALYRPDLVGLWTAILLVFLGVPLLTGLARSGMQALSGESLEIAFHPLRLSALRWLLAVAFLPYEAYNALDAILTALYRMLISRRRLLQWTTAAQTARLFRLAAQRNSAWLKMIASTAMALVLMVGIQLIYQFSGSGVAPALSTAAPLLLLWMASPFIAQRISQPIRQHRIPLTDEQTVLVHQIARRTWGFFERFVGPEDHWLPPDHFQAEPVGIIAHTTSPTNIGLLLTSTLAAYDLGYLSQIGLVTRLASTLDTLGQVERFRGHFFNWYNTTTLQPLRPRYISTVDSGNLAASLIVTAQAAKALPGEPFMRWELWQGYLDTLSNLSWILGGVHTAKSARQVEEINHRIEAMAAEILPARDNPDRWYGLYQAATGVFWKDLSARLIELIESGGSEINLETLRNLQEADLQVERHHLAIQQMISDLAPCVPLFEEVPVLLTTPPYAQLLDRLTSSQPYNLPISQIEVYAAACSAATSVLRDQIKGNRSEPGGETELAETALAWLDELDKATALARAHAADLSEQCARIAGQAEALIREMDFQFLYHPQRRVFHNGYNLDIGQLDENCYDLLASEARIASIIALAKGDVPQAHWLHLNRPASRVDGRFVLLSWNGTMFEYLMPALFLRSYPGTLLAESNEGVVLRQIDYAKSRGVPWGISESGFYRFDADQNYQYRAFGVPGLGFKRGLSDDLVIAPYASLMAIGYDPHGVAQNLSRLVEYQGFGLYGMVEAIDFTPDRLLLGSTSAVVNEYMAHHQGMIMMALANFFHQNVMIRRMHRDARIQSVELLLQEQIPWAVPLQNPSAGDVTGSLRLSAAPVDIQPWSLPLETAIPQVNLLSNGDYSVLLSNMGGGYSTWRGTDLTRWRADGVLDPWGTWIYLQDMDLARDGAKPARGLWSAGFLPVPGDTKDCQVTYFAHMAVYRRTENGITSTMEVIVYPDDPVEIRRVHLHNPSSQPRKLRVTSYGEVILAPQATDVRHPGFNKLFIESEYLPELNLQLFTRRPRSGDEPPIYLGHLLVVENQSEGASSQPAVRDEADRNRFIGRGGSLRRPAALLTPGYLSGTSGATLDPIFALGLEINLKPHENAALAYLTLAGESREAVIDLARRYTSWSMIDRSFHQADIAAQTWLGKQKYDSLVFINTLKVLSALLYPLKEVRAAAETLATNHLGQMNLWRFGISGDYPLILVELEDVQQIDLIREVLQIHSFLRSRRFLVDVVILNHQATNYGAELNGLLYRMVSHVHSEQWLNQRGGIFILYADQIEPQELILLQTVSRYLFKGERGSLDKQMPPDAIQAHYLPDLIPTRPADSAASEEEPLPPLEALQFFNGYGGFSQDGREYVIDLPAGRTTPAPWVNIIGYPDFGFMVSETGSQSTWAANSSENRLTPWSDDPVSDPTGETLYLRDEETTEVWTPTPLPAGDQLPYRVRHGAGYTTFEHHSHGLRQRLTLFASPEDPVKIIHLQVENTRDYPRQITATQYVEWVLGLTHPDSAPYIVVEYDATVACFLASNPYQTEFGQRVAFLIASKPIKGVTADRVEFLGRGGTPAYPAALRRMGLESHLAPGEEPCAALQLHLDLLPGGAEEIYFVLGQGDNREHARQLAQKYQDPAYVGAAWERTHTFWDHQLNTLQVHTPDPTMDLLLNQWTLYQCLSCRVWARSAFYQPGGAYGFRDQLQDVLALLPVDPTVTRGQILNAAFHQFTDGDALHWWHPPSGRGVRTRISDDMLWLPYATALYVETTGDSAILDEPVPFLEAPPLKKEENERYQEYPLTKETYPLIEHCHRALAKGATFGPHGLPLIGTGDWNDGLNRVGIEGKGESVWLAWFLVDVLERFARLCAQRGDQPAAERYRAQAKAYTAAVEQAAWDGAWYRRAYYDDGTPLGSTQNAECQIDAIAQSWSVLSGAGEAGRSRQAMQSALDRLVISRDHLSLLFTPPFDKTSRDPGYIKGYLPGIRENGGQYTHAAVWTAWAMAQLGDGRRAGELFNWLNPINRTDSTDKANTYRVEPYVMAADIYSQPPLVGQGGWTWYTGSAGWVYRLGLTAMLGFKKIGDHLQIDPVIPPDWNEFEIQYTFERARYSIRVANPTHISHGISQVLLDGVSLADPLVPLVDDGKQHRIEVVMGG